jgi:hypothetical protein
VARQQIAVRRGGMLGGKLEPAHARLLAGGQGEFMVAGSVVVFGVAVFGCL